MIGLIPCAEGGSSIDDWNIEGVLFKHAISEAKFAMQNSELTGILWHQGETDSNNGNYKFYYKKLLFIIEILRKELDVPNIPLIIGGLGDFLGKVGFGKNYTEYTLINQELQRFALEQDNCYFITASGLTSNPDSIHIDAVSQRKFGLRYFKAFSNKNYVMEALDNENKIESSYPRIYTKIEKIYMNSMDLGLGKISYENSKYTLNNKCKMIPKLKECR